MHTSATIRRPAIVFGPLHSRRLGRSVGINNIPPKRCSYGCVYCQAGATPRRETARRVFYSTAEIVDAVGARLERCRTAGDHVDYVTFVPSGEPTLDAGLGAAIRAVRAFGYPVAVLTNGSLLTRADVRSDLLAADVVSVKVDTIRSTVWRRLNRPAAGLDLVAIRAALLEFARDFPGRLLTETMVVAGINDDTPSMSSLSRYLARVGPWRAYLSTPTRAPATNVREPDERTMARLFVSLSAHVRSAGMLLAGYPLMLSGSPDALGELESTIAVHPLSEKSVRHFLARSGSGWGVVDDLVERGAIRRQQHGSKAFFVRGAPDSAASRER